MAMLARDGVTNGGGSGHTANGHDATLLGALSITVVQMPQPMNSHTFKMIGRHSSS